MAHVSADERCSWCNTGPVAVVYRNAWDNDADFGICVACDAELATYRKTVEPQPEWHDCLQCGMRYPEDAGVGPGACHACRNEAA